MFKTPEKVDVGDRTFFVHQMTAGQMIRWQTYRTSPNADKVTANFMPLAHCVKDGEGKAVWADATEAEGMSIAERVALEPVVIRMNFFGADEDEKKD